MRPITSRWIAKVFLSWTVLFGVGSVAVQAIRGEPLVSGAVSALLLAVVLTAFSAVVQREDWWRGPEGRAELRRREAEQLRRMVYGDEQPPDVP